MSLIEVICIAVSLAMDALTISMMYGMTIHHFHFRRFLFIGIYFGLFQALMPVGGYFLGNIFRHFVESVHDYLAFLFLFVLGVGMIKDAYQEKEDIHFRLFDLTILAIATSLDAFAIGMTFSFLQVHLLSSCMIIGIMTSVLCFGGASIGCYIGEKLKEKAMLFGGVLLIVLAFKILIVHFI